MILYHLSPSRYRASIQAEGVRRLSFCIGRLVTHALQSRPSVGDLERIAECHDTAVDYLDVWRLSVADEYVIRMGAPNLLIVTDVPPHHVEIVRSGLQER